MKKQSNNTFRKKTNKKQKQKKKKTKKKKNEIKACRNNILNNVLSVKISFVKTD